MSNINLPWKYSHFKNSMGYRKWEAIKHFKDRKKKKELSAAFDSGKKILFIHIPKTAGVSLIKTYEDYFADARHSPVLLYKLLLGENFSDFSTFSIVRNPWARLFSAYIFLKKGGLSGTDPDMGRILLEQCPSFDQFIKEWLPQKGVCSYMHFVPQYEFLCGWSENIMVDHIIKLEQLDNDWPKLINILDMPQREVQRMNASTKKDEYREHYDNESMEIVGSLYKKDIELFNYSYE